MALALRRRSPRSLWQPSSTTSPYPISPPPALPSEPSSARWPCLRRLFRMVSWELSSLSGVFSITMSRWALGALPPSANSYLGQLVVAGGVDSRIRTRAQRKGRKNHEEESHRHCSGQRRHRGSQGCIYVRGLSLIHISEPTRLGMISYAVFCLK